MSTAWSPISTDCPKSFAPASAPSTMSRFTASAKIRMKSEDRAKYAISVQRAAASRKTSWTLAVKAFMTRSPSSPPARRP